MVRRDRSGIGLGEPNIKLGKIPVMRASDAKKRGANISLAPRFALL
jgi:hypothetical protein